DDVRRRAAVNGADVRRRLHVDAAEAHRRDALGGDLDRVDAFLGRHPRVRFEAVYDELEMIRGGRTGEQVSRCIAVEHEAGARLQTRYVEVLRTEEADLLANRERDLEVAVRDLALLQDTQHLADDRQPRLVVSAEDRRA